MAIKTARKIKVLIADDSFFMRKLLRRLLEEAGDFEVMGEAKNGREIVELALHLQPDVITMDYHMPLLTGAMATRQIMLAVKPPPAIVMLSAYTREGAAETLESLRAGAVDFVCKPSGELSLDIEKVADELLCKIRIAAGARVQKFPEFPLGRKRTLSAVEKAGQAAQKGKTPPWLVVIGASTGGPPAIEEIVTHLSLALKAAVLIVQHMPPRFTKSFAERLDKMTNLVVREAVDGDLIEAGTVLIAPGDYHMVIKKINQGAYLVKLNQDPPREDMRPSVDVLFESAAAMWGGRLAAVELTGMGADGTHGVKNIHDAGGFIIAQSLETTVVDSMPGLVISQGLADDILPPHKIAEKINALTSA